MIKQKELNLSNFKNDKNNILDKLQAKLDFDLSSLNEDTLNAILDMVDKHNKAQKAIKNFERFVGWVGSFGLYDMHDLKLHELCVRVDDIVDDEDRDKAIDLFYKFCDDELDYYINSLFPEVIDSYKDWHSFVDYLGNTSKFYFGDVSIYDFVNEFFEYNCGSILDEGYIYLDTTIYLSDIEEFLSSITDDYLDKHGEECVYTDIDENLKWINEDLDNITLLTNRYKLHIKDSFKVMKMLNEFKANQIENFKGWYEYNKECY